MNDTGRVCTKCREWKEFSEFYKSNSNKSGFDSKCKKCESERGKAKYQRNKESVLKRQTEYRAANPEKHRSKNKAWYEANKERKLSKASEWRRSHPEKMREYTRKWESEHPESARERNRRRQRTPRGKIENAVRSGINKAITSTDKRGNKTFNILGYTPQELMAHLEKHFQPGMTWENYGRGKTCWHIDHIVPVSAHNYSTPYDIDFQKCWALKNLRPLWEPENLQKNNKLLGPFQPSLAMELPNPANDNNKREAVA